MSDPRGFMKVSRQTPIPRPVSERVKDYDEVYQPMPAESVRSQASRCMDCGVPFCHTGCPLGNQIPDWNDLIHRNRWQQALEALHSTNNFPEFTGKTCPAPCEAACVLALTSPPVTIKTIEQAIIDKGWEMGWVKPKPPEQETGKRVAVIGSGPAGLAAAQQLRRAGHTVSVYERDDRPGGLMLYGIPDFKMAKEYVTRRIEQMEAEGVRFHVNARVGGNVDAARLHAEHDAILLAIGATKPRNLHIPGRELAGVHFAMPFLTQQNKRGLGDEVPDDEAILATGKDVLIIGGGDTAADCLGTCHRQRAKSVAQLDYNPRPPEKHNPETPWPIWPRILRLTSAHEEGGARDWQVMTKRFIGDSAGRLATVEAVRVVQRLEDGQRIFDEIEGSETLLPCQLALLAIGFTGAETTIAQQLELRMDDKGNVWTRKPGYGTSDAKVFAAGDCRRGQSLVVWAIAEGREAAREVDQALMGRASTLKARDLSGMVLDNQGQRLALSQG